MISIDNILTYNSQPFWYLDIHQCGQAILWSAAVDSHVKHRQEECLFYILGSPSSFCTPCHHNSRRYVWGFVYFRFPMKEKIILAKGRIATSPVNAIGPYARKKKFYFFQRRPPVVQYHKRSNQNNVCVQTRMEAKMRQKPTKHLLDWSFLS